VDLFAEIRRLVRDRGIDRQNAGDRRAGHHTIEVVPHDTRRVRRRGGDLQQGVIRLQRMRLQHDGAIPCADRVYFRRVRERIEERAVTIWLLSSGR